MSAINELISSLLSAVAVGDLDASWLPILNKANAGLAQIESGTTTLALDVACRLCQSCGCANHKDFDACGDCYSPRK